MGSSLLMYSRILGCAYNVFPNDSIFFLCWYILVLFFPFVHYHIKVLPVLLQYVINTYNKQNKTEVPMMAVYYKKNVVGCRNNVIDCFFSRQNEDIINGRVCCKVLLYSNWVKASNLRRRPKLRHVAIVSNVYLIEDTL